MDNKEKPGLFITPLERVIKERNYERVFALLSDKKSNPDIDKITISEVSLIEYAIEHEDLELAKIFIKNGVDVNHENSLGSSPLFLAISSGNIDMTKELIKAGADVNKIDKVNETPIFDAVRAGNKELVEELVKAGADIYHKNKDNKTPLDIIINQEIKEFLEKEAPKLQAKHAVDKMLKAKAARPESEFKGIGYKQTGVSAGYVAKAIDNQKSNMIKVGNKEPSQAFVKNNIGQNAQQDVQNQVDLVREYTAAALYKLALKHQAPDIGLVTRGSELDDKKLGKNALSEDKKQGAIAIRSTFFDNFQTLSSFTGATDTQIEKSDKLKQLQGFEKVMAACLMFGEIDWHAGNIGVISSKDADGKPVYTAAKIDHGRSLHPCEISTVDKLKSERNFLRYQKAGVEINVHKLIEALEDMQKISMDEVINIVRKQINDLKNAGMPMAEINKKYGLIPLATPEDLVYQVCKNIKENRSNLVNLTEEIKKDPQKAALTLGGKAMELKFESNDKKNQEYLQQQKDIARALEYKARVNSKKNALTKHANQMGLTIKDSLKNTMPEGFKVGIAVINTDQPKGKMIIMLNRKDKDILQIIQNKLLPDISASILPNGEMLHLSFDVNDKSREKFDQPFLKHLSNEIAEFRINKLINEWGKAGHIAKVTGNVFKLDQKSDSMGQLVTFCSKPEQRKKKIEAEALIRGIQNGELTKQAVTKALDAIGAPPELKKKLELAAVPVNDRKPSAKR